MELIRARNGETTASYNGKYLHSSYNPSNEGEKFVNSLGIDFSPLCILIIEPALSYCAAPLRKKFPNAKLCAIRFFDYFSDTDKLWDFVFYCDEKFENLSEDLYNTLGEEFLISSLSFDWTPSKNLWQDKSEKTWLEIKKSVLKSRDVLGTRQFFSKRWLKNSVNFFSSVSTTVSIQHTKKAVLIVASGPSLNSSIEFIKKNRSKIFILAVSSAFAPLYHNKITPDIVMSTDGGFWAKKHLDFSGSENCDTIYALSDEAAVPKKILRNQKILPLCYKDSTGEELYKNCGIDFYDAKRNGTVSGTALQFALNFTEKNVFLCGVDLEPTAGFQHTQPNALEIENAKADYKLRNKETRLTASRFSSKNSLEIYRNWFSYNSQKFSERVFRISDNHKFDSNLGEIKDVNWEFAENYLKKQPEIQEKIILKKNTYSDSGKKLEKTLKNILQKDKFIKEIFPLDYLQIQRELSEEKKYGLKEKLLKKIEKMEENLKKCIHQ